jgi:hypothetical protein
MGVVERAQGAKEVTGMGEMYETAGQEGKGSQATKLLRDVRDRLVLHRTPGGEVYAEVPQGDHTEVLPLDGRAFSEWLTCHYMAQLGGTIGPTALNTVVASLKAHARYGGADVRDIYYRVGCAGWDTADEAVYVDLGTKSWQVVEITAGGIAVIPASEAPILFRRTDDMLPLPEPEATDASLEVLLAPFIGHLAVTEQRLFIGWLVAALHPCGPYLQLNLVGEQGSGKSILSRLARALIDPVHAELVGGVKPEELPVLAKHNYLLCFDNVGRLGREESDALCRLATGQGIARRALFTNDEQHSLRARRPVILNGIGDLASESDLLSRTLPLRLPVMDRASRKSEDELWRALHQRLPRILGALYQAVAKALFDRLADEALPEGKRPRMLDAALWVTCAEPALGWPRYTFVDALLGTSAENTYQALEASAVGQAVVVFMRRYADLAHPRRVWQGSATALLKELVAVTPLDVQKQRGWPRAANHLSHDVEAIAPSLRELGLDVRRERIGTGDQRTRVLIITPVSQQWRDAPTFPPAPATPFTGGPTRAATRPAYRPGDDELDGI